MPLSSSHHCPQMIRRNRKGFMRLKCGHEFIPMTGRARCGRCNRCWECCNCAKQPSRLSQVTNNAKPVVQQGQGIEEAIARYRRWWQGKLCKDSTMGVFRLVTDIRVVGNPSFVYGNAYFVFEDGTEHSIFTTSYVPRKYDVEVKS